MRNAYLRPKSRSQQLLFERRMLLDGEIDWPWRVVLFLGLRKSVCLCAVCRIRLGSVLARGRSGHWLTGNSPIRQTEGRNVGSHWSRFLQGHILSAMNSLDAEDVSPRRQGPHHSICASSLQRPWAHQIRARSSRLLHRRIAILT